MLLGLPDMQLFAETVYVVPKPAFHLVQDDCYEMYVL